jgi:hypothetical protein
MSDMGGLAVPAAVETPAHAVTETATKTRTHKAGASEPRMEEARVTTRKLRSRFVGNPGSMRIQIPRKCRYNRTAAEVE